MNKCETCHGSGVDDIDHRYTYTIIMGEIEDYPLTVYIACETCGGSGEVAGTLEPQP